MISVRRLSGSLALAAVCGLAGCASKLGQIDAVRWGEIHPGMTRAEVIKVLGPPRNTSAQNNQEVMDYVEDRGVFITKGTGIFRQYYVQLQGDKVTGYGPKDMSAEKESDTSKRGVTEERNDKLGKDRQGRIKPGDPSLLRIGMARDEVLRKLGKPENVTADGESEVLNYMLERPWWQDRPFRVKIVEGKVQSYEIVER